MIRLRKGKVAEIRAVRPGLVELVAEVDGARRPAVAYSALVGPVAVDDVVTLNTTAVELGLGSGGFDFVVAVDGPHQMDFDPGGHVMKLRYTPLQLKVLSVEEEASPYREAIAACSSLDGMPVILGNLHSTLLPAALAVRRFAGPGCRLVYLMTDGAALPMAWSRTVDALQAAGLVVATVSVGQAFGGDFEAVNKYSGLLAAKAAAQGDIAVVAMGPGILGTGTKWGHTGVEQGEWLDAVNLLGGKAFAVPRISFADPRPRHRGVSHHFLTALGEVAHTPAEVCLPTLEGPERRMVWEQLAAFPARGHLLREIDTGFVREMLQTAPFKPQSMGRGYEDDPVFFDAAAGAGRAAAEAWLRDRT